MRMAPTGTMEEEVRISHSGLVARSPEGHAAKGMQIKGNEDLWVEIQAHTFRNWVNEQIKPTGHNLSFSFVFDVLTRIVPQKITTHLK